MWINCERRAEKYSAEVAFIMEVNEAAVVIKAAIENSVSVVISVKSSESESRAVNYML